MMPKVHLKLKLRSLVKVQQMNILAKNTAVTQCQYFVKDDWMEPVAWETASPKHWNSKKMSFDLKNLD